MRFGLHLGEIEELAEAGDEAGLAWLLELLPDEAEEAQAELRQWLAGRGKGEIGKAES